MGKGIGKEESGSDFNSCGADAHGHRRAVLGYGGAGPLGGHLAAGSGRARHCLLGLMALAFVSFGAVLGVRELWVGPLGFPPWADGLLLVLLGASITFQILCFALLRSLVRPEEGSALGAGSAKSARAGHLRVADQGYLYPTVVIALSPTSS